MSPVSEMRNSGRFAVRGVAGLVCTLSHSGGMANETDHGPVPNSVPGPDEDEFGEFDPKQPEFSNLWECLFWAYRHHAKIEFYRVRNIEFLSISLAINETHREPAHDAEFRHKVVSPLKIFQALETCLRNARKTTNLE